MVSYHQFFFFYLPRSTRSTRLSFVRHCSFRKKNWNTNETPLFFPRNKCTFFSLISQYSMFLCFYVSRYSCLVYRNHHLFFNCHFIRLHYCLFLIYPSLLLRASFVCVSLSHSFRCFRSLCSLPRLVTIKMFYNFPSRVLCYGFYSGYSLLKEQFLYEFNLSKVKIFFFLWLWL